MHYEVLLREYISKYLKIQATKSTLNYFEITPFLNKFTSILTSLYAHLHQVLLKRRHHTFIKRDFVFYFKYTHKKARKQSAGLWSR